MQTGRGMSSAVRSSFLIFIGILVHRANCHAALRTVSLVKSTGPLDQTSASGPEVTCFGSTCSITSCAASCQAQKGCRLFSYNPTNMKCILGRPSDGPDSTHYASYYAGSICFLLVFRISYCPQGITSRKFELLSLGIACSDIIVLSIRFLFPD